ncbi:uncharacterized protein LOC122058423 [Macadamia integrifolia]|uniref:uncharacterized protein LOC122058423 n=1 Tax=Macadamia integrifolia TaxID=60698 RepID=UPI001C4F2914|nr:uncharacterized protein LOC122058423 [Macadamia integrifolia]
MASKGSQTISLKVLIDEKNNIVAMVETSGDFVDILLISFLTMPMGTIALRLLKASLLSKSVLTDALVNFSLKIPKEENRGICNGRSGRFYSTFKTVRCSCGKMMDKEICMAKVDHEAAGSVGDGGVFVCGTTKFMVTDDLQVKSISPATIVTLLHKVGIKDKRSLQETTLNIGSEEILNLLKRSLISKTPLTDVFVRKQGILTSEGLNFEMADAVQSKSSGSTSYIYISTIHEYEVNDE